MEPSKWKQRDSHKLLTLENEEKRRKIAIQKTLIKIFSRDLKPHEPYIFRTNFHDL